MKAPRETSERLTYGIVALINACVICTFALVLWPAPDPIPMTVAAFPSPIHVAKLEAAEAEPITGVPKRIIVPSVGIQTSVQPGAYDVDANTWTIDSTSAFHADITVPVNNTNGTTLIYGHAEWGIFGKLPDTKEGAEAYVDTADGYRFTYVFESNRQVDPADTSALTSSGPPKLLLQTCSGAFDVYRTLVTFNLISVVYYG